MLNREYTTCIGSILGEAAGWSPYGRAHAGAANPLANSMRTLVSHQDGPPMVAVWCPQGGGGGGRGRGAAPAPGARRDRRRAR